MVHLHRTTYILEWAVYIIVSWVKKAICMWTLVILEREYQMLLISYLGQPNCGEGRPVISDAWTNVQLLKLPCNDKRCPLPIHHITDMSHVRCVSVLENVCGRRWRSIYDLRQPRQMLWFLVSNLLSRLPLITEQLSVLDKYNYKNLAVEI